MSLEKITTIAALELLDGGPAQIRWRVAITEGGLEITSSNLREVREPGNDISDLPADAQAAITAHWTPERVAAWQAAQVPVEVPGEE